MNTNKISILIIAITFVLGTGGMSLYYYYYLKPSPERQIQLRINEDIRKGICDRIQSEIDTFKEFPNSYKRGTLRDIENEARETTKINIINNHYELPIVFSDHKNTLVSNCPDIAKRWVKIPTNFPEYYETELQQVGLTEKNYGIRKTLATQDSGKKRIALVIGNSTYASRPLKNPVNDADDIADYLEKIGFGVTKIKNATLPQLKNSLRFFEAEIKQNDIALIYYSGHGIEFRGGNYLIPVDAHIRDEEDIPRQSVNISEIIIRFSADHKKTNIFILDACRNTPIFSKTRSVGSGLKEITAPNGTIIAFSAGPGQVANDGNGRNSPYTAILLKEAQKPNKKIEDILKAASQNVSLETGGKQIPWYNSSLTGDFYFIKND